MIRSYRKSIAAKRLSSLKEIEKKQCNDTSVTGEKSKLNEKGRERDKV